MPADLERLLRDGLDRHATRAPLGSADGGRLDDVFDRVDRRRLARRRRTAGVGSLAVLGVGAIGVVTLGRAPSADPVAGPDGSEAPVEVVPSTIDPSGLVWRCTGEFAREMEDQTVSFFEQCEQVPRPDGNAVPTTVVGVQQPLPEHVDAPTEVVSVSTTTSTTVLVDDPPDATGERSAVEQAYVIQAGDSLSGIAAAFGVDMETICSYNSWPDCVDPPHLLLPGDEIRIPPDAVDRS